MRRWEEIFPETDREVLRQTGFGTKQEFGKTPALPIIDVVRRAIGSKPMPAIKSIQEFKRSCGEAGWKALPNIQKLLSSCRSGGMPIVYTMGDSGTRAVYPTPRVKGWTLAEDTNPAGLEFPDAIAPLPSELVVRKPVPDAFFGTSLAMCLHAKGVDTLLVTGTATSNCVRATVFGGHANGFKCFLVEECTFDRFELSHLVNLFDMNAKVADVITLDEALRYVAEIGPSR